MDKSLPDYSSLFYLFPLPAWIYDLDFLDILDINEAAISHYGYSKDEFLSLTIKDLRPKEEIVNLLSAHQAITKQDGNIFFGVFTHQKKSGEKIRMKVNGHKVDFGDKEAMMVVCQDVTTEEAQVKLLLDTETKLKAASVIANLGYWRFGLEDNSLTWTDQVFHIWGRSKDQFELNFDYFLDTIHPDDLEALKKQHKDSLLQEKEHNFIYRIILPNNSIKWIHELGRLVKDKKGKSIALEGTVQDITVQKSEEHRLKLLESVITNTKDAIVITEAEPLDEPGPKIIFVNEAFTKMTGYKAEEVIGKSPRILQGPNTNREEMARLGRSLRNWESCEITTINYKKNGEEFWINFVITPVANEEGWYTHWISIERDVTEQKLKELEMELLAQISINFSNEHDLISATNGLCKSVSKFGNFDWVEVWNSNLEKSQMQLFSHYFVDPEDKIFYEHSAKINAFKLAESLVGKVWSEGAQLLWNDLENNQDFVRREAAKKIGLNAVLGIPLIFNDEVVGVLQIGTKHNANYLKKYTQLFKQLEGYIGSELNRKKLENDLSHLYDTIPDIICLVDFQGRFLKINNSGCQLLGYSEAEILYHSLEEFVHPKDKEISTNELLKLGECNTILNFENRYLTKNGTIVWLSWSCNSSIEEGLIYASAKNITEEKKLRELNRQAGSLAKIGSWEVDLVKQTVYWSEEIHLMHETNPESFVPDLESGINFYREDFRQMVQSTIEKSISNGKPFDFEAVLVTTKKKELWVRTTGKAEFMDGVCTRVYGSFQNINERKLAAIQLEDSLKALKDYEFAIDQSAIIAFTDKKGVITSVNDNFCKISKYDRKEILGKTHHLINSNHHPKEFFIDLWKTIASGKVWQGEIKNKAKDGSYYWVYTTIVPFLDENNKPFQYLAIRFDITSRKLAEQERTSLQATLENSLNEIFVFDAESFKFSFVNKGALLNLGYSAEEIKALTPIDLKPEFTEASFRKLVEPLVTHEKEKIIFFTNHKRKDGSIYPVEVHLQFTTEGNIKRFLAIILDITARKKSEEENRFKANLLSTIGQAAIATDLDGVVNYWNKAAEIIYGWTREEAIGKNIMLLTTPDTSEEQAKAIMEGLKKGETWSGEFNVKKKDGTIFPAQITNSPIYNVHDILTGIIGISSDIRQEVKNKELLKLYTHELERSNEELEQFAFVTSHDLQEPLRMISSFMDLLKLKYGDKLDDKGKQYIHFATDGAKRMKQIILDLLDYSKATRPTEGIEMVDLNEVLSTFKHLRRKLISEKSALIIGGDLPTLNTYKVAITQILHCILDNALKYSKADTSPIIELNVVENDQDWTFSIKDNGIGIDKKYYEKIFVIFQRLHNRDEYEGTGIGLSIAKRHVEFLGGRIWLDSTPGEGSVFHFSIQKIK